MSSASFVAIIAAVLTQAPPPAAEGGAAKQIEAEVMQVLDAYMAAFNRSDMDGWEETFHFPHYRLASGRMSVLDGPGKQTDVPRRLAAIGWHHSRWDHRRLIYADDTKAHVDTRFIRYREDGSVIATSNSLYILTREAGRWGVKMRSSFAP